MPRQTPEEMRRRAQRVLTGRDDPENATVITMDEAPADVVDSPNPLTRADDYETSEEGGRAIRHRAPNQRLELLIQFREAGEEGLTDEEAGTRAHLLHACYWHRCTDLRSEGWIAWAPDGRKRKGNARVNRKVSVITDEGQAALSRRGI